MTMNIARRALLVLFTAGLGMQLLACSVHVDDKDKKNQNIDIATPFANLKVNTGEKAVDNGIPVYPGARLRPEENGDNHAANINIGGASFGLKVIAAEYETDDAPEKVKAFYESRLKSFGNVLVCRGHEGGSDVHISGHQESQKLSCSDAKGDGWELKVGTTDNQHLVSIEPCGSGTRFGTVLIRTHGKEGTL